MDDKHDPTTAMLNDENHPVRTRIDDNRPPLRKVGSHLQFVVNNREMMD